MVPTDSSLAKGLTKRFMRENQAETLKLLKYIKREFPKINTRKRWDLFIKNVWLNDSVLINKYLGGSQRKPYFCISFFEKKDWNPQNAFDERGNYNPELGWPEDSLIEDFFVFQFNPHVIVKRETIKYRNSV